MNIIFKNKYIKYKSKYINEKIKLINEEEKEQLINEKLQEKFGIDNIKFKFRMFLVNECLNFYIENNIIIISWINECTNTKDTIKKVEEVARTVNINKIILDDGSELINEIDGKEYRISLSILYILAHNKSWYNSLGYISDNYENELIHNEKLINLSLDNFIENKDLLSRFLYIFNNYTANDIVKDVMKSIKNNKIKTIEEFNIVKELLDYAKSKLLYNHKLTKIL